MIFGQLIDSCSCDGEEKAEMQNLMNSCGVTKTVLHFLCSQTIHPFRFFCIVNLCIKLLEGGNSEVQASFYDYFVTSQNSENFFYKLNEMINGEIRYINKPKSLHEKVDICFKNINYSYNTENVVSITNVLRLLQLLTENHNEKLQV